MRVVAVAEPERVPDLMQCDGLHTPGVQRRSTADVRGQRARSAIGRFLHSWALAELVPTVVVAYTLFTVFLLVVRVFASHAVVDLVWEGSSILTEVIAVPLLAAFSIWVGIAISTRSGDVRVAQQLSGLAMLPMLGLVALITFRVIQPSLELAVGVAAFLSALDLLGWRFVSQMFDRERLLTRYRAR